MFIAISLYRNLPTDVYKMTNRSDRCLSKWTELRLNEELVCDGPLRRDCATKVASEQITTQAMCTGQ
jgi:hypothetical protein